MEDVQSLKHTTWECKYHVVWIPKCRKKLLYGQLRKTVGEVLRGLAVFFNSSDFVIPACPESFFRKNYSFIHGCHLVGPYFF